MKRGIIAVIAAGVCWLSICIQPAHGTLITIAIEAEVDYVQDYGNYLEGNISPGDIITGTYTYDSTTPDSSPADPIQGNYWHYSPPAGIFLTVGGFDFQTHPTNVEFHVAIRNDIQPSGEDISAIVSYNNLPLSNSTAVDHISWQLYDSAGSALSSDALPTTAPILDQWQETLLLLQADRAYAIDAHVTSAIPEPATVILLAAGAFLLIRNQY